MVHFHKAIVLCLLLFNTSAHSMEKKVVQNSQSTWELWLELAHPISKKDFDNKKTGIVNTEYTPQAINLDAIKMHIDQKYTHADPEMKRVAELFSIKENNGPYTFKIVEKIIVNKEEFLLDSDEHPSKIIALNLILSVLVRHLNHDEHNNSEIFISLPCVNFFYSTSRKIFELGGKAQAENNQNYEKIRFLAEENKTLKKIIDPSCYISHTLHEGLNSSKQVIKNNAPASTLWLRLEQTISKKDFAASTGIPVNTKYKEKTIGVDHIKNHINQNYTNTNPEITKVTELFFIQGNNEPYAFKIVEKIVVNKEEFPLDSNETKNIIFTLNSILVGLVRHITYNDKNKNNIENKSELFMSPPCAHFFYRKLREIFQVGARAQTENNQNDTKIRSLTEENETLKRTIDPFYCILYTLNQNPNSEKDTPNSPTKKIKLSKEEEAE